MALTVTLLRLLSPHHHSFFAGLSNKHQICVVRPPICSLYLLLIASSFTDHITGVLCKVTTLPRAEQSAPAHVACCVGLVLGFILAIFCGLCYSLQWQLAHEKSLYSTRKGLQ